MNTSNYIVSENINETKPESAVPSGLTVLTQFFRSGRLVLPAIFSSGILFQWAFVLVGFYPSGLLSVPKVCTEIG